MCDWIQGTIGDRGGLVCSVLCVNTNILVSAEHKPSASSLRENAYADRYRGL